MRPGEKLFEELLTVEEGTGATKHEKIFVAHIKAMDEKQLQQGLLALRQAMYDGDVINVMKKLVPTYMTVTDSRENESVVNQQEYQSNSKIRISEHNTKYQTADGIPH